MPTARRECRILPAVQLSYLFCRRADCRDGGDVFRVESALFNNGTYATSTRWTVSATASSISSLTCRKYPLVSPVMPPRRRFVKK